ncbi:hypothetical protein GJ496_007639 [Pomphorhynchus laevis]|nr:hypothetical protein GJ496_007639 [Pomphorhynchus laevis]
MPVGDNSNARRLDNLSIHCILFILIITNETVNFMFFSTEKGQFIKQPGALITINRCTNSWKSVFTLDTISIEFFRSISPDRMDIRFLFDWLIDKLLGYQCFVYFVLGISHIFRCIKCIAVILITKNLFDTIKRLKYA